MASSFWTFSRQALVPPSLSRSQPSLGRGQAGAHRTQLPDELLNPDKGFSGCGLETIAGLKIALGLERVDLVGGNGRDDVNEGIDDGSLLGVIEGRELLDMADDGLGHVPGIEQGFIV